jgi:hypothetical protein
MMMHRCTPLQPTTMFRYEQIGAKIKDLIAAVREPGSAAKYGVVTTDVALGNGKACSTALLPMSATF